jgi:hypothetical protein
MNWQAVPFSAGRSFAALFYFVRHGVLQQEFCGADSPAMFQAQDVITASPENLNDGYFSF